jgi:hypothetical protein
MSDDDEEFERDFEKNAEPFRKYFGELYFTMAEWSQGKFDALGLQTHDERHAYFICELVYGGLMKEDTERHPEIAPVRDFYIAQLHKWAVMQHPVPWADTRAKIATMLKGWESSFYNGEHMLLPEIDMFEHVADALSIPTEIDEQLIDITNRLARLREW